MMPCLARFSRYDWLTVSVPVPLVIVAASAVDAAVTETATALATATQTATARNLDPNIDNQLHSRGLLTGQQRMSSWPGRDQIDGNTIGFSPHAVLVNAQPTSHRRARTPN